MNTAVPEVQRMFCLLYLLVGSVGLFGNFTIFRILQKYKEKSTLHTQLAFGNMIMLSSMVLSSPSALYGKWLFGDLLCQCFGFQVFFAGFATGSFTCLICLQSYLATCHNKFYSRYSKTMTRYLPSVVWSYSVIFSLAPLLGWNSFKVDQRGSSCGIDIRNKGSNYSYLMTTHTVFIGLVLMAVYCLIMMYRKKLDTSQSHLPVLNKTELRQVSMILFVCLGLGSLPFYLRIVHFLGGYSPLFNSFLSVEFSHWCIKMGSLVSCFAYMITSSNFKTMVVRKIMRLKDEDRKD